MSYMALEVAPFCTRVLAPFYLRVSTTWYTIHYDGPGFRATETIRVGRSGKILEAVLKT